jgi:hypothetical protein
VKNVRVAYLLLLAWTLAIAAVAFTAMRGIDILPGLKAGDS